MIRTFKNLLKNEYLQEFKERRFIMNWEQQLNSYQ